MTDYISSRKGVTNPRSGGSPSTVRKSKGKQTERFRKIEMGQFVSAINDCLKGKQSMYVLDPQKNYKSSTIQAGTIM